MQLLPVIGVIVVALSAAGLPPAADTVSKPHRIVSMNLCTDELVLRLADRQNIVSITWKAREPDQSNAADLAQGIPINHGLAEEIIPLKPDLLLAGVYTTRPTVALLKRAGMRAVDADLPRSSENRREASTSSPRWIATLPGWRGNDHLFRQRRSCSMPTITLLGAVR
jgi:iron complex transport system substrate-binding protein